MPLTRAAPTQLRHADATGPEDSLVHPVCGDGPAWSAGMVLGILCLESEVAQKNRVLNPKVVQHPAMSMIQGFQPVPRVLYRVVICLGFGDVPEGMIQNLQLNLSIRGTTFGLRPLKV